MYLTGGLNGAPSLTNSSFYKELALFIFQNFRNAKKIIELGVGFSPQTAIKLRQLLPRIEIIVVDKNPEALKGLDSYGLKAVQDDLFKPKLEIYRSTDLLYSIHPPLELIEPMKNLAERVKAPLLIKPLSEDAYFYGFYKWKQVKLSPCTLYLWRNE